MEVAARLWLGSVDTDILAHINPRKTDVTARRRRALKKLDRELSKGNFKNALAWVKQLQGKPGRLRGFGAATQVPKRLSALDELKFDGVDLYSLGPLVDSVMDSIGRCTQLDLLQEAQIGKPGSLMDVQGSKSIFEDHRLRCLQHEAGHFLVGYLLGALPKRYRVLKKEDLRHGNIAGGEIAFLGFEFLTEVVATAAWMLKKNIKEEVSCMQIGGAKMLNENIIKGEAFDRGRRAKITSKTLNKYSCMILGGLVAEHLVFGCSKGLRSDVQQLNKTLECLGLSEIEAKFQVRWAAINTIFILHRHCEARSRLVEAMERGQSVGFCIDAIEKTIDGKEP